MKELTWQVVLGVALVAASAVLYLLHFFIFRDAHHIFIYMLGDIAFLPVEVLLVSLVIHRVFASHERRSRLAKMNMVVGAFFAEVGTALLAKFAALDRRVDAVRPNLVVGKDWTARDFAAARCRLADYNFAVEVDAGSLADLGDLLGRERSFILGLLENPTLLEHDAVTEALWAVTHLAEELAWRPSFRDLPPADYAHLAGDVQRAYGRVVAIWLLYVEHLHKSYPYLYSLVVRTNPFNPAAEVEIRAAS